MPSVSEYGRTRRDVHTILSGSGFSRDGQGRIQKGVVVGRADPASTAATNTPIKMDTTIDTARNFGQESELAKNIELASHNGARIQHLYGVAPDEVSVTAESIVGGSGELANAPILEQLSDVTVEHVDSADQTLTEVDVEFVYESLPTSPATGEAVNLNPLSGELEAPTTDDYQVSYKYLSWDEAIAAAADVITVGEVGGILVTSEADAVKQTLDETLAGVNDTDRGIRGQYRLAFGVAPAMPNATNASGEAIIDTATYGDTVDNDALFVTAGARLSETPPAVDPTASTPTSGSDLLSPGSAETVKTVVGGVFGKMVGNQLDNPVYKDTVEGFEGRQLTQTFSPDERDALVDQQVIPLLDGSATDTGRIEIDDNTSSSTASDYVRDFHRLRVKDVVNLIFRTIGQAAESEFIIFGEDGLDQEVEETGMDKFDELARAGIIKGNPDQRLGADPTGNLLDRTETAADTGTPAAGQQEGGEQQQYYAVEVTQTDVDEITISYAYVPSNLVKQVENRGVIYDQVTAQVTEETQPA